MAIYKLGDIGNLKGGISTLDKNKYGCGLYFVNYMDIFKNYNLKDNNLLTLKKYNANEKEYEKYFLNYGDALFTASSETPNEIAMSSVYLSNEKAIFNGFSKKYTYDQNILLPKFASFLFRGSNFRSQATSYTTGFTRFNISQSDLLKIKVEVPSIKIQQQIIDIIEQNEKLFLSYSKCVRIDTLENAKKDMQSLIDIIEPIDKLINISQNQMTLLLKVMQNLYNVSEKTPLKLCDVANVELGGTPSTKNKEMWNGQIPWINSGKLTNQLFPLKAEKFITKLGLKKSNIANIGELLFSIIDPEVNKVSIVNEEVAFNQSVAKIISEHNLYFEIINAMPYFRSVKNGAAQQSINKQLILNAPINKTKINFFSEFEILAKLNEIILKATSTKEQLIKLLIK